VVYCGFAWDQECEQQVWQSLVSIYDEVYDARWGTKSAQKPHTVPWLGGVLLPSIIFLPRDSVLMLADLERCIAWTLFEAQRCLRKQPFAAKLLKASGEIVSIQPKNGAAFSLMELKEFVGGYIQIVQPPGNSGAILVVNENGKSAGLLKNALATRMWQECCKPGSPRSQDDIVGDVVLCQTSQVL